MPITICKYRFKILFLEFFKVSYFLIGYFKWDHAVLTTSIQNQTA